MKKRLLELNKDQRDLLIYRIQHYFFNERGEELGLLGATLILDFIIEQLAPIFYNQGMDDAIVAITQHVEDLHGLKL
jgi:uncharacterized protein (DUF2164 family)